MKNVYYILVVIVVLLIGCDPPFDIARPGDKLSGYITHIDTNLVLNGGFYSVSVFSADSSNPFHRVPLRTDSIPQLIRSDFHYYSPYDMDGIPPGRYYVASTWSRYPRIPNEVPIVLGIYGCDTSASCTSYGLLTYPDVEGHFRNITSWTDLNKRLN
jgi:hypothetical protein